MESTSVEIISRMEAVRAKKRERIADLNEESSRMTDWREHVRAAPLMSLAASIAVGALGAATLTGGSTQSTRPALESSSGMDTSTKKTVARAAFSTVWSMAMPMLTRYVKQRVALAIAGAAKGNDNVEREEYHDGQHT